MELILLVALHILVFTAGFNFGRLSEMKHTCKQLEEIDAMIEGLINELESELRKNEVTECK